ATRREKPKSIGRSKLSATSTWAFCLMLFGYASIRAGGFADNFARDESLHDLRSAVANLEADDVAHPLLMWQIKTESEMTVEQKALMQDLRRQLGREPLGAGREPSVRFAAIFEP